MSASVCDYVKFATSLSTGYILSDQREQFENNVIGIHGYCTFSNVMNGMGTVLSPLVGVIRIVVASIFLYLLSNNKGTIDDFKKFYFQLQIARGILELLCLGIILGLVVDPIMTAVNRDSLTPQSETTPKDYEDLYETAWLGLSYYLPSDIEALETRGKLSKYCVFHNVMNGAGIFLSPLVGIIRMVVAGIFLYLLSKELKPQEIDISTTDILVEVTADPDLVQEKEFKKYYYKIQLLKGGLELVGLGPILNLIVGPILTIHAHNLPCAIMERALHSDPSVDQVLDNLEYGATPGA